ncbi:hypothetical protein ACTJI8_05740 [Microbacterium sp. 22303]|uniref:hypothetical protein n=1 Tax=Microbacterium sp. 22303 TaxID=3453905 RepID=UPI003F85AA95
MVAKLTTLGWTPLPGAIPETVLPDTVYVIPTRTAMPSGDVVDGELRYTEHVRYLPKAARAVGLPVEFSMAEGTRKYLSEYSVDPETWALGLACLTMANDWLIAVVSLFIGERAKFQGWTAEEATRLPLRLKVVETETELNYEIEGEGADVLAALRELNGAAKTRQANGGQEVG